MFGSVHDRVCIKRFGRALIALAFLIANIAPSYAQGLATASYAGPAAMMGVRIPFGGKGTPSSQPMVGLRFVSSWQAEPGSTSPQGYRFTPAVEVGLSFRGDPILRLGSFELLDQLRASAEGTQRETFCGRNLGICLGGAAVIIAVAVLAFGDSEGCRPSMQQGEYPPGQDPCKCYEANGCS